MNTQIGIIDFARFNGRNPGDVGSTFLRVDNLVAKDKDFHIWKQGQKFDALIFQKVYWQYMAELYDGVKILDLADPDYVKGGRQGGVDLVAMSKYIDTITCSSPALAKAIQKFIKNIPVVCVPDRLNFDIFPEPKIHTKKAKTVVWFGYAGNAKKVLTEMVLQGLARQKLKLRVVSNEDFNPYEDFGLEIENIKYKSDTAYYEIQKGDFVINPKSLRELDFKYKSNNKTIISWKLGLPVAEDGEEMRRFMEPGERNKEVEKRVEEVDKDYNIVDSGAQYKQIICQVLEEKKKKNK